ncbi:hypothetical protein [Pseudoalteromonas denitrificans]|uniref:Uncharacterized protein n=1 Tax=Pseudoalteromonas denitrificans DSM 6059 TaxID=1123010 RepID=A0A1I1ESJ2_9GAMM|nr:hypothetical protein [Pseudoalteromonas denitrificans]SFB90085.1 hypothetical protein SAMN02745724_00422 [Pseudoalteromonas denitrificans DSM 6059]
MLKRLLLLSSFMLIQPVSAYTSDLVICNDCSLSQSMNAAKYSVVSKRSSDIIVADIKNENVIKFKVFKTTDEYGEPSITARQISPTSDEIHDIGVIYQYRRDLVDLMVEMTSMPGLGMPGTTPPSKSRTGYIYTGTLRAKGNPLDFITTAAIQNDLYDYYFAKTTSLIDRVTQNIFNAIKIPGAYELDAYLDIEFYADSLMEVPNGTAQVTFNPASRQFKILSSRDKDNNTIPTTIAELASNDYRFSSNDSANRFNNYVQKFTKKEGGPAIQCTPTRVSTTGLGFIFYYNCK